jgi:hypothetical protein
MLLVDPGLGAQATELGLEIPHAPNRVGDQKQEKEKVEHSHETGVDRQEILEGHHVLVFLGLFHHLDNSSHSDELVQLGEPQELEHRRILLPVASRLLRDHPVVREDREHVQKEPRFHVVGRNLPRVVDQPIVLIPIRRPEKDENVDQDYQVYRFVDNHPVHRHRLDEGHFEGGHDRGPAKEDNQERIPNHEEVAVRVEDPAPPLSLPARVLDLRKPLPVFGLQVSLSV